MVKTRDELHDYIRSYKDKELDDVNATAEKHFDLSNNADKSLGSQLITLASALFVVIGGFVINADTLQNDAIRAIVTLAIVSLLVSLVAGLWNLDNISSFWLAVGRHKHEEGKIINEDTSETYDELESLRTKLLSHRSKSLTKSDTRARTAQVFSFGVGVGFLFILILIKIYSL